MSENDPKGADRRFVISAAGAVAVGVGLGPAWADDAAGLATSPPSPDVQEVKPGAVRAPWTREGAVQVCGGRIHWAQMGSGPPVVLLPKLGGWLADWRHVAPALARSHRVIALDPPGHGDSLMNGPPPFLLSQEESASMIVRALDALGVDRCAMVGNSMGGSISLVTAVLWPRRVDRLAMISTALPAAVPLADIVKSAANSGQIYDGNITYDAFYKPFGASRLAYDDYLLSERKAGAWKDPSERGVRRAGLLDYVVRVACPTVLIYGDRAGAGYQRYLPEVRRRRPDIQVLQIPDSGTFTHQDNPEATAKTLETFLA